MPIDAAEVPRPEDLTPAPQRAGQFAARGATIFTPVER